MCKTCRERRSVSLRCGLEPRTSVLAVTLEVRIRAVTGFEQSFKGDRHADSWPGTWTVRWLARPLAPAGPVRNEPGWQRRRQHLTAQRVHRSARERERVLLAGDVDRRAGVRRDLQPRRQVASLRLQPEQLR